MKKLLFYVAGMLLLPAVVSSCSGGNAEKEREDSIRRADSIAAVRQLQEVEAEARLESIKNEATSIKPSFFLERASSVTYTFTSTGETSSQLKSVGFKKISSKNVDLSETHGEEYYDVYRETTTYNRSNENGTSTVTVIYYSEIDGDYDEIVKIDFDSPEAMENFIDKLLQMRFVSRISDSQFNIGEAKEYGAIIGKITGKNQFELYTKEAINLPR